MAQLLDSNEIFFTPFEPKVANRFIMFIEGIPAYLIKAASRPSIDQGEVILDHINVERKLKEKCRSDRARIQIGRISTFGLLEMSRQRLRESAVKWNIALTNESFALKLLKTVELKSISNKSKNVKIAVCEKISNFINDNFLEDIKYFQKKNKIKIEIVNDNSLIVPDYIIEFQNKSRKIIEKIESLSKLKKLELSDNNNINIKKIKKFKKFKKKKFYKKKFYKKKN